MESIVALPKLFIISCCNSLSASVNSIIIGAIPSANFSLVIALSAMLSVEIAFSEITT